jgi:glycosyltransferase involved in cell wall biosynthesis
MNQQQVNFEPIKCLLIAPADPLTGRLRAGPLRRYNHPPPGVTYGLRTDRFTYPPTAGHYRLSPANVAMAAARFLAEHAIPLRHHGYDLIHSFFWDVRRYEIPWVHESDQGFGQFLEGYSTISSSIRTKAVELFSIYLNTLKCKAVIAWSEWARMGYISDGVDPSKISVIPPSFGQIYDRRRHEGINILFIGRDFVRKGGKVALEAFETLKEFSNTRLLYVGKIDDKRIVTRMKANRRIHYFPRISSLELEGQIFPVSDLFFLPTRADAFAISVVEAMSRGIPVVASNICALPEIVENGVSGILSRPDEPNLFARNIAALLSDGNRMVHMGKEARRRVELLFGKERTESPLREAYVNAVKPESRLRTR